MAAFRLVQPGSGHLPFNARVDVIGMGGQPGRLGAQYRFRGNDPLFETHRRGTHVFFGTREVRFRHAELFSRLLAKMPLLRDLQFNLLARIRILDFIEMGLRTGLAVFVERLAAVEKGEETMLYPVLCL